MKYRFSTRADNDLDRADLWWRENRPKAAPTALRDAIHAAIEQLLVAPKSGVVWGTRGGDIVRRVVMPDIERVLYYALDDDEMLVILAIVGTRRERQPRFGRPKS